MASATTELSIRRESLISAGANVILIAVHLVTLGVLTRALGPAGVGAYFFALSAAFVAIIPSRELSQVMRKRVSEVDSPSAEYFGLAQGGTLCYLVLFALALSLLAPLLVAETPLTDGTVVAFGVYTVVLTQSAMSTRLYDAVGSPGASMLSQALRESAFLGGILALLWVGAVSPVTVLLVGAGIHLLTALGIYVVVGLVPRIPSRASLVRAGSFGKWSAPTGIASHVWQQAPTMLLGVVLGGSAVATYETAKRLTSVGSYLATCINDPLLVKVSAMGSADAEVMGYVELAMDYTPSVAIPGLFLLAPVAPELLGLAAGPAYASGGFVLVCVAAVHVFAGLKTPLTAAITGVDEPKYVCLLTVATLVVGVPAIALGAAVGGLAGVAVALVALEVASVLAAELAAAAVFGELVRPKSIHVQFGAAAVAGTTVWIASRSLDVTDLSTLGAILAVGALVHAGFFALGSKRFRDGAVRTYRDVVRAATAVAPG